MAKNIILEANDNTLITITPEWMKQKFVEMNQLLFNGMLPMCRLSLFTAGKGSNGGVLGWFKTRRSYSVIQEYKHWRGKIIGIQYHPQGESTFVDPEDFAYYMHPEIQLNGNYNWTEKAALSTLVHEMCHYRQHIDGFYAGKEVRTRTGSEFRFLHHGDDFMQIANEVSMKSNRFFTVERIASAEQMNEMDFTDSVKEKHKMQASNGIHFFKFELAAPESRSGKVYKFAYAIPSATKYKDYAQYIPTMNSFRYKRAIDCVTTDGNIKRYHTVNKVGTWYYTQATSIDAVLPDVIVDSQTEIPIGDVNRMEKPYYLFKLKYVKPYVLLGARKSDSYKYSYKIVKPENFFKALNFVNGSKNQFSYASYCEVYDPKILSYKVLDIKRNYLVNSLSDILPKVKQEQDVVLYGNDSSQQTQTNNDATVNSLGSFLYGTGGNPHLNALKQQQPTVKRYNIVLQLKKNGVSNGSFVLQNATEQEIKEQMKQRFPGWSDDVINKMFNNYAKEQQSAIALQESDVRYVVEQVIQEVFNHTGTT